MSRWYSANVLQSLPGGRRLWRFSAKGDRFVFDGEKTLTLQEPAPAAAVGKNWQSLLRPKLNVAWLPPDKVFFRAVQLPGADAAEIASMVELQLEKLSPLPVTHIVWSLYLMPPVRGQAGRVANGHRHHRRPRLRGGVPGRSRSRASWPTASNLPAWTNCCRSR